MTETPMDLNLNTSEDVNEIFACHKSRDPEIEKFDRTINFL